MLILNSILTHNEMLVHSWIVIHNPNWIHNINTQHPPFAPWITRVGHSTGDRGSCVTWLIHMCDMTHSYVWHDSFICETWLIVQGTAPVLYTIHSYTTSCVWVLYTIHHIQYTPLYCAHLSLFPSSGRAVANLHSEHLYSHPAGARQLRTVALRRRAPLKCENALTEIRNLGRRKAAEGQAATCPSPLLPRAP